MVEDRGLLLSIHENLDLFRPWGADVIFLTPLLLNSQYFQRKRSKTNRVAVWASPHDLFWHCQCFLWCLVPALSTAVVIISFITVKFRATGAFVAEMINTKILTPIPIPIVLEIIFTIAVPIPIVLEMNFPIVVPIPIFNQSYFSNTNT